LSAEVFRNATLSERTVLESRLRRAILHFESRIRVEALEVDAVDLNEGILRIRVEYVIVATNSRSNRVFPFYKTEGTLIPAR
jgi:predicted component of type VI protein secretion system